MNYLEMPVGAQPHLGDLPKSPWQHQPKLQEVPHFNYDARWFHSTLQPMIGEDKKLNLNWSIRQKTLPNSPQITFVSVPYIPTCLHTPCMCFPALPGLPVQGCTSTQIPRISLHAQTAEPASPCVPQPQGAPGASQLQDCGSLHRLEAQLLPSLFQPPTLLQSLDAAKSLTFGSGSHGPRPAPRTSSAQS